MSQLARVNSRKYAKLRILLIIFYTLSLLFFTSGAISSFNAHYKPLLLNYSLISIVLQLPFLLILIFKDKLLIEQRIFRYFVLLFLILPYLAPLGFIKLD